MKKSAIFGWESVFGFTLKQLLKSKGNIILMCIMFLVSLLAYPIITAMNSKDVDNTVTSIEKLYIMDSTDMELEKWLDLKKMEFEGKLPEKIEFTDKLLKDEKSTDETLLDLNSEAEMGSAYIEISYSAERFTFFIEGVYGSKGSVSNTDATKITNLLSNNIKMQLAEYKGITEEQLAYLNTEITTDTVHFDPNAAEKDNEGGSKPGISSGEYGVIIIMLCAIIMLVTLCGEQVATAVVQEKSSKLVEFLLTSVKPLALLVGKVLAVFVMAMVDVAAVVLGVIGSNIITNSLFPNNTGSVLEALEGVMAQSGETVQAMHIQPFMIPIAVIILLLGVLFYSVIAALAGACVSRMEELTEGLKLFTIIMIVGVYFSMVVCGMDMGGVAPDSLKMIATYLPFSSVVFTTSYLVVGQLGALEGFISLGIMLISTVLIFWLASRVYESMIYHKGENLKVKDIIMLSKQKKGGKHHE